ncbi:hypothetical protein IAT38_003315 [Cryptococcus sp. DSM 104549]
MMMARSAAILHRQQEVVSDTDDALSWISVAVFPTERYSFADADIRLVSSEGSVFQVHSYQLRAASPVFRAMLDTCRQPGAEPQEIHLTDEKLEYDRVLASFLDLPFLSPCGLHRSTSPSLRDDPFRHLFALLDKYQAAAALQAFEYVLLHYTSNNEFCPYRMFRLGCKLRLPKLCTAAIAKGRGYKWLANRTTPDRRRRDDVGVPNQSVFDLSAAPMGLLRVMPDDYKFALLRANRAVPPIPTANFGKMSKVFRRELENLSHVVLSPESSAGSSP